MINLLYVDLFCGAGGTSTGVERAKVNGEQCAKVIACVNHDANAIASHAANHPEALHFTEDIRTLDLSPLISHVERCKIEYPEAKVVLWASLECTNFSKAKGGLPRDVDSRTLADHLSRYAHELNPDYIQIENVEEFMAWGDMDENGKPISMDKGRLYRRWVNNVKKYGYHFEHRIMNAADYGAYTSRKRFFGQFARKGLPITWPQATHCKEGVETLFGKMNKWKPVKDVLDFSDEGVSIFTRKKPLSEKTLERIYAGLIKFVAGGKDKWMLKYNSVNGATGKHNPPGIDEPCPTISCQNRLGIVQTRFLSKYFSGHPEHKNISVEGPAHTIRCKDSHALVDCRFLSAYYTSGDNNSTIDKPCPTVRTKDTFNLVQPFFMNYYSGGGQHSDLNNPSPAILSTPKQRVVSCRFIDQQFGQSRPCATDKPLGAVTTKDKYSLVSCRMDEVHPYIVCTRSGEVAIQIYETDSPMTRKIKKFMAIYGIMDILMRMLKIPELKRIMGFPEDYVLIGTQADQKKFIGNAVEVNMARVMCEATSKKLFELKVAA